MIEMPRSTLNLIRECLAIEGSFLSLSVFQIQIFRIEMQGRFLLPPGKRLLAAPDFLLLRRLGRTALSHRLVYVVTQQLDRKSTRLNSSHQIISYAVFCLKKNKI